MTQADVDGNGVLDYGEFVAVIIHLQKIENDELFKLAFMFFDKDGSTYIELDELREALTDELGEPDVSVLNDIMREVDADKVISKSLKQSSLTMMSYIYQFLSWTVGVACVLAGWAYKL